MTEETTDTPDLSQYFKTGEENRKLVVSLHRELVTAEWSHISSVGDQILEMVDERSNPQVMIDLSQLEHMGSSMVALLVKIWKRAESKGGAVSFLSTHEGINQVLELAGLAKVWAICDTREEALDKLGGTTEQTGRNLAPFLVVVSLFCTGLAGAMLGMKLSGQHFIGAETEQQMQIAAGAVGGILGIWVFATAHRFVKVLGLLSAVASIGLASSAVYFLMN